MTQFFHSLTELGEHLNHVMQHEFRHNLHHALDAIGETVEHRVHEKIGVYQFNSGPYPGWPPLSQETLERKSRYGQGMGGNPDTPLYATGAFEQDISHRVFMDELKVEIGTNKDYMIYNELGTAKIPARPIFGPAAHEVVPTMLNEIKTLAGHGVAGIIYMDSNPNNPGQGVT